MIKIAIAGVGNCASALIQGLHYYSADKEAACAGLMHDDIGGWRPQDIEIVAAFDIDVRKVGRPLREAVFAPPNCALVFCQDLPRATVKVSMAPLLDGVAEHMADYPEHQAFRPSAEPPVDVAKVLKASGAQVLLNYLPVGSDAAAKHYAEACLEAGVALINCAPVFIASDPAWAARFRAAGLPILGDDIKSQLGATIVHRMLTRLFGERGVVIDRTYQLNTGGNTDFLNMLARERLTSKKISKTRAVTSQMAQEIGADNVHIGPSDYVPWQKDNKICFIRIEGRGFGDVPLEMDLKLSVQDSPNSAGVVIDLIRLARVAKDQGLGGPLEAPSAYYMKHPPQQMNDEVARSLTAEFILQAAQREAETV
jgi:myo-inositol-1-phosphate synthase